MSRQVEELLRVWREGERLLAELPPLDPDHERVRHVVAVMSHLYQDLTAEGGNTPDAIHSSTDTIVAARLTLARARARLVVD